LLYNLLKIILKIALRIFFKSLKINSKENAPEKGALLVVANHPNTFMDPLVVASFLRPQVFFIANASIFTNRFTKWLFRNLNMIPIQRKHDTNKEKFDNTKIFEHCYTHLGKKGTILIFPEGTSIRARRLQMLKNGTARIALGAEQKNDFNLNLKILTIGLNYSKPESFRSEVFVNVDEPIVVKDFQKLFQENENEAINRLTETIRERLEKHTIVTANEAQDRLAKQIEELYAPILEEEIELSKDEKEQQFLIKKGIVEAIQYFEEKDPQRVVDFRPKIDRYLRTLDRLKLNDGVFSNNKKNNIWLESLKNMS
jgi:1-acyl-sn-glycerol-3-phosphate acyltransferase